jgi:hypothetical protein
VAVNFAEVVILPVVVVIAFKSMAATTITVLQTTAAAVGILSADLDMSASLASASHKISGAAVYRAVHSVEVAIQAAVQEIAFKSMVAITTIADKSFALSIIDRFSPPILLELF